MAEWRDFYFNPVVNLGKIAVVRYILSQSHKESTIVERSCLDANLAVHFSSSPTSCIVIYMSSISEEIVQMVTADSQGPVSERRLSEC